MDLIPPVGYAPRGAEHLRLSLQQRKAVSAWHPAAGAAAWPGSAALPGQPLAHKFPVWSPLLSVPAAERFHKYKTHRHFANTRFLVRSQNPYYFVRALAS